VTDVAVAETRVNLWEALAGRAPGQPVGPADPGLWRAVAERVNPAKARPILRGGVEEVELTSARGVAYRMLRSPDGRGACYLRLTPEEAQLAHLMDGTRTLARLVADFAAISGRLAPDQVRRVVADLAGNRMLEELPVDAFAPLARVRRRPWPIRFGSALLAFVRGRRMVLANVDGLAGLLYRAGGRLLFTRPAAALAFAVAAVGLVAFGAQWWAGEQSVFLTGDSYLVGAAVLLGLNVLALACHELGHALAAKHAGRRVPSAGLLVYFGIPSVFVDTTDVWMAGRRARLLTTAAGPATGLVLAGASALVGFMVPAAAPWCFKLSFAWYVNALFNLNPFLALDGYYLLMDWVEIPNLRTRGLAWVVARLRRRPPAWSTLDREGRLIALYGMLAVGWLLIALNIGYRVYMDRVGGLVIGLWRSGWTARLLVVAVVAALMSPMVYVLAGWAARRWRRLRARLAERRVELDLPRRIDALRGSTLRELPLSTLDIMARRSRWVYPRTGEQLIFANQALPEVFAVVEGALEGRAPGDPSGTVRERVGVGGVVGLGAALTGSPAPLAWYAAGTRLLAVPSAAVAALAGPAGVGGGEYGTDAEVRALALDSPALAGLPHDDRVRLAAAAVPVSLAPGAPITLNGPDDAVVLASGVSVTPDGTELGRGTLIGPAGVEHPGAVATARTQVRLFSLPALAGSAPVTGASEARRAPVFGVHPPAAYPPLASPPGPPPPDTDAEVDGRFERRLRWVLALVLLIGLLFTGGNVLLTPLGWSEMPSDKALLHVERGTTTATVDGALYDLGAGDDIYVGAADSVRVDPASRASLTFRGGSSSVLCAGTRLSVGGLSSDGHPVAPRADLVLESGRMVLDTASTTSAFEPLAAVVALPMGPAVNTGSAWFALDPDGIAVAAGVVRLAGATVDPVGGRLGCPGEEPGTRASGTPSPSPSTGLTDTPSLTPSLTPSPSPSPSASAGTTTSTTTRPPTSSTTRTTPPPPPGPRISWFTDPGANQAHLEQLLPTGASCNGGQVLYAYPVVQVDPADQSNVARIVVYWTGFGKGSAAMNWDGRYYGTIGPVSYPGVPNAGGSLSVYVMAWDKQGHSSRINGTPIPVLKCGG
jgi:putative peptide zinc metalloprotease protein